MMMLFMIFFTSMMWLREMTHNTARDVLTKLNTYYIETMKETGVYLTEIEQKDASGYLKLQMDFISNSLTNSHLVQMTIIIFALCSSFGIFELEGGTKFATATAPAWGSIDVTRAVINAISSAKAAGRTAVTPFAGPRSDSGSRP